MSDTKPTPLSGDHPVDSITATKIRLDASAPDLLAACKAGRKYFEAVLGEWARSEGKLEGSGGIVQGDSLDELFEVWKDKTNAAIAKAEPPTEGKTDERA